MSLNLIASADLDKNKNLFSIFHLNINSIFGKLHDIDVILNLGVHDIVMINESKLDESIPKKFYKHNDYYKLRRDRGGDSGGGGILVFIKKIYETVFSYQSLCYEFIYFELKINNTKYAFVSAYKTPTNVKGCDFLLALQEFLFTGDLNSTPIFIIGDLNMDLFDASKSKRLNEFMSFMHYKNYVNEPTREATCFFQDTQSFKNTKTLTTFTI